MLNEIDGIDEDKRRKQIASADELLALTVGEWLEDFNGAHTKSVSKNRAHLQDRLREYDPEIKKDMMLYEFFLKLHNEASRLGEDGNAGKCR